MGQPVIVITHYVSCLRKGMHKLRTVLSRAGRTIELILSNTQSKQQKIRGLNGSLECTVCRLEQGKVSLANGMQCTFRTAKRCRNERYREMLVGQGRRRGKRLSYTHSFEKERVRTRYHNVNKNPTHQSSCNLSREGWAEEKKERTAKCARGCEIIDMVGTYITYIPHTGSKKDRRSVVQISFTVRD